MKILITGTAGFIGFHLAQRLLRNGESVIGVDSINDYYDVNLKYDRLKFTGIQRESIAYGKRVESSIFPGYSFLQIQLEDKEGLSKLFKKENFDVVVNLAAQAGVRYSITNPEAYINSNIVGFANVLEACRHNDVGNLVYASSSSVYGANTEIPFSIHHSVDHPVSLYAATKKSNELMAHTYSHLFGLPTTGLRFFTVYGPWGRPDMALFLFTKAILERKAIQIYNHGDMFRDFTYIDDIVAGIEKTVYNPSSANPEWSGDSPDPGTSKARYKIYNIGNSSPVNLMDFISAIESNIGIEAIKEYLPIQPGDVPSTYADVKDLERDFGYKPTTSIEEGIKNFIFWYKDYYKK